VSAWLASEVRQRVAAVRDALPRECQATDASAFLDSIVTAFDAVVRRPPLAAQRALSVSRDTSASTGKLVQLVETDPGLSQGLLRYANSAFYARGGGRCVSLMNAAQRVGTSGVHNVVLRAMVDGLLCRPGGAFQGYVDQVWEHMVRTAPVARGLALHFDIQPDEAYALGLLHDVGKLVVFDRLGEIRRVLRREVRLDSPTLSVVLRMLHEPLGGLAAMQWGLGPAVAHAIATHHRSPVPEMLDQRCELLFVAERLDHWRNGTGSTGDAPPLDEWWRDGALNADRKEVDVEIASLPASEELCV
jgi:HD-like signal output (HDOD) protein